MSDRDKSEGRGREGAVAIDGECVAMNGFPRSDFYSACAQVLPVLFLAIAVEFRVLMYTPDEVKEELKRGKSAGLYVAVNVLAIGGLVATIALGEGMALWALSEQRSPREASVFVIGALAASVVWVVLAPLANLLGEIQKTRSSWTSAWMVTWTFLIVAMLVMPVWAGIRFIEDLR